MHPIVAERTRLSLYLAAWVPLAALVAVMLVLSAGSSWLEASLLSVPLLLVYAFLCLTAWYPCRALPLPAGRHSGGGRTSVTRALGTHIGTSVASSLLWVVMAFGLAQLLERTSLAAAGVVDRMREAAPLLLAFGILLYLLSVAVHYLAVTFEATREAEGRALRAELAAREAELHALKTQLDPHFIFNSLNSISSLVGSDAAAARQMCVQLGSFLRDSLRLGRRQTITLQQELAMMRSYLAVEQVRYGARLAVEEEVDSAVGHCPVPPLLLQPLVENALKHGISQLVEGGTLRLVAHRDARLLRLIVENPYDPDSELNGAQGAGVGLDNVRSRLRSLYDTAARLKVRNDGGIFRVEVVLPVRGVDEPRQQGSMGHESP